MQPRPLTPEPTIPLPQQKKISIKQMDDIRCQLGLYNIYFVFEYFLAGHLLSWVLTKKCEPLYRNVRLLVLRDDIYAMS